MLRSETRTSWCALRFSLLLAPLLTFHGLAPAALGLPDVGFRSTRDSHAVRCLEVCKYLYKSMTKATTNKSARQSSVGQVGDAAGVESWTTLRASAKAPPLPGQSPSSDVTLSDLHSILQDAVCPLVKRWAQTLTCYLGRFVGLSLCTLS